MAKRKKRQRQEIPKDETKADRFVRVVSPRVRKAVKAIDILGYCSGPGYEHTPEQITEIQDALLRAVGRVTDRFSSKQKVQDKFAFGAK